MGVAPQRVARLGIPLRPNTAAAMCRRHRQARTILRKARSQTRASQTEMRRRLDLDPELPLVLFMGGGAGPAAWSSECGRWPRWRNKPGASFRSRSSTGSNVRSRNALEGISWPLPVRVYGYVPSTADLMTAADIVATKPGSVTVRRGLGHGASLDPEPAGRGARRRQYPLRGARAGRVLCPQPSGGGRRQRPPAPNSRTSAGKWGNAQPVWEHRTPHGAPWT